MVMVMVAVVVDELLQICKALRARYRYRVGSVPSCCCVALTIHIYIYIHIFIEWGKEGGGA